MVTTEFAFSKTSRQEQFSIAYIRAIASAAGYSVALGNIDEDSLDIFVRQRSTSTSDENVFPDYATLKIQLKCTYHHQPSSDKFIHFKLSKKNYDDLRHETGEPFILVVLYIPSKNETTWLIENKDSMALYNTAHWLSLRGEAPISTKTKTVLVPLKQRFDVEGLTQLMNRLAKGEMP